MATLGTWRARPSQTMPASTEASEMRSTTESKKAPRRELRPVALATAPSSMSGRPDRRLSRPPTRSWPPAISAPAPTLPARPSAVRLLAVNPALASAWPAGSVTCRKLSRALFEESTEILSTGGTPPLRRPSVWTGRLARLACTFCHLNSPPRTVLAQPEGTVAVVASRTRLPAGTWVNGVRPDGECGGAPVARRGEHDLPSVAVLTAGRSRTLKSYPTDRVRNVLIVGHGGAGKTSLVESLLFATGAVNRVGRVEDGGTVTDFEPEETRKQISVSLALAPVEHDGYKVNLLDAPGYADFVGEVRSALPAVDAVLFVVSAVDGVETQTEVVWTMADELGLPRAFFINKLDRDRASFARALDAIQETFGKQCPPLYLPIGEEHEFSGVVGLLSGRAFTYADGKRSEGEVPAAQADTAESMRAQLIETIIQEAEDEELMDRYLGGDEIAPADLIPDLEKAVAGGRLYPVLAGAGTKGIGPVELLEVMTQAFPSPAERQPYQGTAPGSEDTASRIADPYVGRLNLFRVVSGTFRPDQTVLNATKGKDERVGHLHTLRGKNQEALDEVVAGDIGAVSKLAETSTGDTLCAKEAPFVLQAPVMPDPLLPIAIAPRSRGDEEKLSSGLGRIEAEDLTLRVERNPETKQTILWGMGENHIEVVLERLKRKFGVQVDQ